MTSSARTLVLFGTPGLALTLWQYWRSAAVCYDGSATSTLFWGLQLLMCGLPLVVVRSVHRSGAHGGDTAVRLLLLAYVPTTLALRLAELCHAVP
jgi:hypothetical protein